MAREDFTTESGRLTDYEFTVTDAYFGVVPGYRDGTDWFLHFVGTTNSEAQPIMDREGYHPSWRLGDDWESIDSGKTVSHPTKKKFHTATPMGEFIDALAMITADDDGNAAFDPDPLAGDFSPFVCEGYIGMRFLMGEVEHVSTFGGEKRKYTRTIPSEFLGMADVAAPAAAPAAVEPSAPSDKALAAKLKIAAKKAPDFAAFEAAALAIEGVVEDDNLLESVLDESPSGFYASAKA